MYTVVPVAFPLAPAQSYTCTIALAEMDVSCSLIDCMQCLYIRSLYMYISMGCSTCMLFSDLFPGCTQHASLVERYAASTFQTHLRQSKPVPPRVLRGDHIARHVFPALWNDGTAIGRWTGDNHCQSSAATVQNNIVQIPVTTSQRALL